MYDPDTKVAVTAVQQAAQLCEAVRQQQQSPAYEKSDASPVTVADFGSQAIICRALSDRFPTDAIIAEEDAAMLRQPQNHDRALAVTQQVQQIFPEATPQTVIDWIDRGSSAIAPRYWTLDPIDGTKGYIRGDQYAIALALIEEGRVQLGILACPALPQTPDQPHGKKGVLFIAKRGQGCRMSPLQGNPSHRISVNFTRRDLCSIESVESAHSDRQAQLQLAQTLGITHPPLQLDSQAKYGAVARGEADYYVRIPLPGSSLRRENIWDHAAGAIVVEEAGGCVTDLDGKSLDFSVGAKLIRNNGIIASNGAIHQRILTAIAQC
ncbi:3'(2'),5'-bisphosphate nucleotidase [Spirulina sp. CS-785/01]|uniref:3'(2'),5'-bisphosphate nucleotidase n=1 Tax=Spirulina sp. CS-785/01 TaxID=3021716 RepID=UPI00232BCEB0|nr:3'(2'),5'-bisphosphate nucleotidase [Spirulina sp. CS-785/01]MDB9311661.1 3'(2'),5'-bisphosphate nucleotidase [Spirulina sp. CS-785/01]